MQKTALRFTKNEASIGVAKLERYAEGWLLDGEIRQHSQQTLTTRKIITSKLVWFLRHKEYEECGLMELRQFLAYLTKGHLEPGGRFGNPHLTQPVRPRTVKDYHSHLRTFFRWLVDEGGVDACPMDGIAPPIARADQIQPFTETQVAALMQAARKSRHPRRDEALVLFLLDTGVRASELAGLRMENVDLTGKRAVVLGKGNKHRTVYFGRATTKALWQYLNAEPREVTEPLFHSDRGPQAGEPLSRWGVRQIIERMGVVAKVEATRCSPHTFRHTFAVSFLRNGGNVFTLQQLMGHTSTAMTQRYVALAQADIEQQHRQFSPVDRIRNKSRV
jgi:site-specific recombinase XerD